MRWLKHPSAIFAPIVPAQLLIKSLHFQPGTLGPVTSILLFSWNFISQQYSSHLPRWSPHGVKCGKSQEDSEGQASGSRDFMHLLKTAARANTQEVTGPMHLGQVAVVLQAGPHHPLLHTPSLDYSDPWIIFMKYNVSVVIWNIQFLF